MKVYSYKDYLEGVFKPYEIFWCPICNKTNVTKSGMALRCEICRIDMIELPSRIKKYVDFNVGKLTKEDITEYLV